MAAGETSTVTDRGGPRALLVPVAEADELSRGLADGWVVRRSRRGPGPARPRRPDPATPRSEEILAEDRGDLMQ